METPRVMAPGNPIDFQVAARELDDMEAIPDVGEVMDPAFTQSLDKFHVELVSVLERQLESYKTLRENEQFTSRQEINQRRTRLELEQRFDAEGNLISNYKDGHAELGLLMGWSFQGCKNGAANLRKGLLEESKRPYIITTRGEGRENAVKEKVVYAILDDMLRFGKFRERFAYLTNLIPREGTSILRYEMGRTARWVQDAKGAWMEADPRPQPRITVWPLDQVFVSNPDRPEANDQEGVFFTTKNVSLGNLEGDEIVTVGGNPAGGKFRNLDAVRKLTEDYAGGAADPATTLFPVATLVEYEGPLPLAHWAKTGKITYRIAKFFGVDVGMDPNPDDERQVATWGRRLARIRHWRVAYLKDWTAGYGGRNGGRIVLQFTPIETDRNSLYRFLWLQDGLRFYANSVPDLGGRIEAAADGLMNADMWVTHINAHPPTGVDVTAFENPSLDYVEERINTPDSVFPVKQTRNPKEAVNQLFRQHDPLVNDKIDRLKREFEFTTGVSAAAKGTDVGRGTGTLGEIEINEAKSSIEMMAVLLDCGTEICRLAKDLLEDTLRVMRLPAPLIENDFERNQEQLNTLALKPFTDYAARVSGLSTKEIEEMLPTIDGLLEEIEFRPPFSAANNRGVLTQLLINLFTATAGEGFQDKVEFVKTALETAGFSRAEELTRSYGGMDPDAEIRLLSMGTWVAPDPKENLLQHLMAHAAALNEIRQRMATGQATAGDDVALIQLQQHIQRTLELIGLQMELMNTVGAMAPTQGNPPPRDNAQEKPKSDRRMERETNQEARREQTPSAPGGVAL